MCYSPCQEYSPRYIHSAPSFRSSSGPCLNITSSRWPCLTSLSKLVFPPRPQSSSFSIPCFRFIFYFIIWHCIFIGWLVVYFQIQGGNFAHFVHCLIYSQTPEQFLVHGKYWMWKNGLLLLYTVPGLVAFIFAFLLYYPTKETWFSQEAWREVLLLITLSHPAVFHCLHPCNPWGTDLHYNTVTLYHLPLLLCPPSLRHWLPVL